MKMEIMEATKVTKQPAVRLDERESTLLCETQM